MRLVTYRSASGARLGALGGRGLVDLRGAVERLLARRYGRALAERFAAVAVPQDMVSFLEGGAGALELAREALELVERAGHEEVLAEGQLLAPLRPRSLRDFMAFEHHVRAAAERRGRPVPPAWYEMPVYYRGNHLAILGPDEELPWPPFTQQLDFEMELAAVVGRPGRDVPEERAWEHIVGYTIMNDFSARDVQMREMTVQLGPAKGKDFATALGPALLVPERPGPPALRMVARVNGQTWGEGNTGEMHWSFAQMVAFISWGQRIWPGEVLGSGTLACGLDLGRSLRPGDVVELEAEGIGVLRNRVAP